MIDYGCYQDADKAIYMQYMLHPIDMNHMIDYVPFLSPIHVLLHLNIRMINLIIC